MVAMKCHCIAPAIGALLIVLTSGSTGAQSRAPVLSFVNPSEGPVGTQVTLIGSGFTVGDNTVHFGIGGSKHVPSENGKTIRYAIPAYVSPCDLIEPGLPRCMAPAKGVDAGFHEMSVSNANGRTSAVLFAVK
jgi:hypothetical protein